MENSNFLETKTDKASDILFLAIMDWVSLLLASLINPFFAIPFAIVSFVKSLSLKSTLMKVISTIIMVFVSVMLIYVIVTLLTSIPIIE